MKLRLLDIVQKEGQLCLSCEPTDSAACCPECNCQSWSVHKNRTRRLSAVEFMSRLHIRRILTHDQIQALDAAREMARVISGGIITKDAISRRLGDRLSSRLVHRCTDTICRRYEEKRKAVREQRKSLEQKGELRMIRKDSIWKYIHSGQTSSKALQAISITNPDVSRIIDSCRDFCRMIHYEKGSLSVEQWIKIARLCKCRKLNGFVDYIESDINAVIQACTSEYNNGFMEGSVSKFKAIKKIHVQ